MSVWMVALRSEFDHYLDEPMPLVTLLQDWITS